MKKTVAVIFFSTFFIALGIMTAYSSYKPKIEVTATYPDLSTVKSSQKTSLHHI